MGAERVLFLIPLDRPFQFGSLAEEGRARFVAGRDPALSSSSLGLEPGSKAVQARSRL